MTALRVSTADAERLLADATPGPWDNGALQVYSTAGCPLHGPGGNPLADASGSRCVCRVVVNNALDRDRPLIAAAPDLAADLLDARRDLAAERGRREAAEAQVADTDERVLALLWPAPDDVAVVASDVVRWLHDYDDPPCPCCPGPTLHGLSQMRAHAVGTARALVEAIDAREKLAAAVREALGVYLDALHRASATASHHTTLQRLAADAVDPSTVERAGSEARSAAAACHEARTALDALLGVRA